MVTAEIEETISLPSWTAALKDICGALPGVSLSYQNLLNQSMNVRRSKWKREWFYKMTTLLFGCLLLSCGRSFSSAWCWGTVRASPLATVSSNRQRPWMSSFWHSRFVVMSSLNVCVSSSVPLLLNTLGFSSKGGADFKGNEPVTRFNIFNICSSCSLVLVQKKAGGDGHKKNWLTSGVG